MNRIRMTESISLNLSLHPGEAYPADNIVFCSGMLPPLQCLTQQEAHLLFCALISTEQIDLFLSFHDDALLFEHCDTLPMHAMGECVSASSSPMSYWCIGVLMYWYCRRSREVLVSDYTDMLSLLL
jgi:hypothetical protein